MIEVEDWTVVEASEEDKLLGLMGEIPQHSNDASVTRFGVAIVAGGKSFGVH